MPNIRAPRPSKTPGATRAKPLEAMQKLARREAQADTLLARAQALIHAMAQQIREVDVEAPLPLDVTWLRKDIAAWRDE